MIRRISYLLVLSLLSATSAFAIEGSDPVSWTLDARQNRVAHPAVQSRLDQQPAWQDFLARHGDRWIAEWDEATRTPVRFYGEGWDVDASMLAGIEQAAFEQAVAANLAAAEKE